MSNFFSRFWKKSNVKPPARRSLRVETLESRELLSVTPLSFGMESTFGVESAFVTNSESDAPSDLTVTDQGNGIFLFQWQNNAPNASGYYLCYSTDGGVTWDMDLAKYVAGKANTSTTMELDAIDYVFNVRAVTDSIGYNPDWVVVANAASRPNAPTELTGVKLANGGIQLDWTDNSSDETGFELQYSTVGNAEWTKVETYAPDTTSAVFVPKPGVDYEFRIQAQNAAGGFSWSNIVQISSDYGKPAAPDGLTVIEQSDGTLKIEWNDNSTNETVFTLKISEKTAGGTTWWTTTRNFGGTNLEPTYSTTFTPREGSTYQFSVQAANLFGGSGWTDPVEITIEIPPVEPPTNLKATVAADGTCVLTWEPSATPDVYRYIVEWSSTTYPDRWSPSYTDSDTSWSIKFYPGITCYCRVYAEGRNGKSEYTDTVTIIAEGAAAPKAPSNMSIYHAPDGTYLLSWLDNSDNETRFEIEQSTDGGATWTLAKTVIYVSSTSTNFTPENGVDYLFRMRAINDYGQSEWSNVAVQTLQPPLQIAVSNVTTTGANLSWNANANASYYVIEAGYRKTPNSDLTFQSLGRTSAAAYAAANLLNGTEYTFRLSAYNAAGELLDVDQVQAITVALTPGVASSLKAKTESDDSVLLTWKAGKNANDYLVEISATGLDGSWEAVMPDETPSATSARISGLDPNTKYFFRVISLNILSEESKPTAKVNATTLMRIPESSPVETEIVAFDEKSVSLVWESVEYATGYIIERSDNGGATWKKVATATGKTEATIKSLKAGTEYLFRISATNKAGTAEFGADISQQTRVAKPAAPTLKLASGLVTATWKSLAGAGEYEVQRAVAGSNQWRTVGTVSASGTSPAKFIDVAVLANTKYEYRIVAIAKNAGSDSLASAVKSISTPPAMPENVVVAVTGDKTATFTWDASNGAVSYKIEKYVNGRWSSAGTSKTVQVTIKSLKPETEYLFRVVAVNKAGSSAPSDEIAVLTTISPSTAPKTKVAAGGVMTVTWKYDKTAVSYTVQRAGAGSTEWIDLATVSNSSTKPSFIDGELEANKSYQYRVVTNGRLTSSAPSPICKAVTTPPATPSTLAAQTIETKQIVLAWEAVPGATSYKIEKYVNGRWTSAGTSKTTTLTLKSLKASTEYILRITAIGKAGSSLPSDSITVRSAD